MKHCSIFIAIAVFVTLLSASCSSNLTKGMRYEKMYQEKPISILVMPPINNTTNVEAKELLYTSISTPLIEAGYYVFSPHLSLELLKAESAYDAELFIEKDLAPFAKVFGADAVVFTQIDEWKKVGLGIQTTLSYIVRSTHTNEVLFERKCNLYLDLSVNTPSKNKSTLSMLVDLAAGAIQTAVTDHIVAARKCNYYSLKDIPKGKYSPLFNQDQESQAYPKDIQEAVK